MNIPEDVMKLARNAAAELSVFQDGVHTDVISRAILTDREARTGWRVPDGYKLVPVEPAEEMVRAGDVAAAKAWVTGERMAAAIVKAAIAAAPSPSLRETEGGKEIAAYATEWRYKIPHGPDGEGNYAWVCRGGDMVATMRTHHAKAICDRMNSSDLLLEAEKALEPFAKAGELFGDASPEGFDQCIYRPAKGDEWSLCGNDLRAARSTLAKIRGRG